jgi:hypothetical protein
MPCTESIHTEMHAQCAPADTLSARLALAIPRRPWTPVIISDADVKPAPAKRRQRKSLLSARIRQVQRAGLPIAAITADETIVIGKPNEAHDDDETPKDAAWRKSWGLK